VRVIVSSSFRTIPSWSEFAGLKQAIQQSLTTMKRKPRGLVAGGAWIGGVKIDDATYQIIRDLNETTKRLAALSSVREDGVELLWFGVMVAFILGSAVYDGLGYRTPRCHGCRTFA
jgi:hypothetical protein